MGPQPPGPAALFAEELAVWPEEPLDVLVPVPVSPPPLPALKEPLPLWVSPELVLLLVLVLPVVTQTPSLPSSSWVPFAVLKLLADLLVQVPWSEPSAEVEPSS